MQKWRQFRSVIYLDSPCQNAVNVKCMLDSSRSHKNYRHKMHSPTLRSMSEYNKIEMQPPRHIDRNLEPDPIKIQVQIENVIPDL